MAKRTNDRTNGHQNRAAAAAAAAVVTNRSAPVPKSGSGDQSPRVRLSPVPFGFLLLSFFQGRVQVYNPGPCIAEDTVEGKRLNGMIVLSLNVRKFCITCLASVGEDIPSSTGYNEDAY